MIPQILTTCLSITFLLVFSVIPGAEELYNFTGGGYPSHFFVQILPLVIGIIILVVCIHIWITGPRGAFKHGVKDLGGFGLKNNGAISTFGWKRPVEERGQLKRTAIWIPEAGSWL